MLRRVSCGIVMMSCWMRKTFSQLSELETLDHLQCLFVPLDSVSVIHLSAHRVFIDTQAFFLNKENTFKTSLDCKLVCAVVVLLKLTNVLHLFLVFVLPTSPSKTLFSCQSNGPSRQRPSLASASEHCVLWPHRLSEALSVTILFIFPNLRRVILLKTEP